MTPKLTIIPSYSTRACLTFSHQASSSPRSWPSTNRTTLKELLPHSHTATGMQILFSILFTVLIRTRQRSCAVRGLAMIKNGRYHKLLGLPDGAAQLWQGVLNLRWGFHAQKEADQDRYGKVEQLGSGEFQASDIVEVTMENGKPVWGVARYPYSDDLDLVMVLGVPVNGEAFVKTVWFNRADDNHKSLDRSKYNRI